MNYKSRLYHWLPLLLLLLLTKWIPAANGQIPLPATSPVYQPPDQVKRFGAIEATMVNFQSKQLFYVVSPTVADRQNPGEQIPVEVRAKQIEENLNWVVAPNLNQEVDEWQITTNFDPKTFQIAIATLNNATVLVATDIHRSQPLDLLTVTPLDAKYYGLTVEELAELWQDRIEQTLIINLQERSPDVVIQQILRASLIALGVVGLSLLIGILQRLLKRQYKFLQTRRVTQTEENRDEARNSENQVELADIADSLQTKTFTSQPSLEQQYRALKFLHWLLIQGQIILWMAGISAILYLIPFTKLLAAKIWLIPINLLIVWLLIELTNRASDIAIDVVAKDWQMPAFLRFFYIADAQRKSVRTTTAVRSIKTLKTLIVWTIGITLLLKDLGVPIRSVVFGGAILAFAVSFSLQNLIKDVVNGCVILLEDQYAIGDVITIGATTGLVENMSLRSTQVRTSNGRLVTIPNSSIVQVENLTQTWSRVDLSIELAYDTDVQKALEIIQKTAYEMYDDVEWRDRILDPPKVLGIDGLSHSGLAISIWIKTQPSEQWQVGREFRLRIKLALEAHHIQIGMPQQTVWHHVTSVE